MKRAKRNKEQGISYSQANNIARTIAREVDKKRSEVKAAIIRFAPPEDPTSKVKLATLKSLWAWPVSRPQAIKMLFRENDPSGSFTHVPF